MLPLSILALVCATLFAGAALYISLVEHPARLDLTDGPMLAQWQPSYKRALPIQSALAIAGGASGLVLGYLSLDWRWLVGGVLLLTNWPFTLLVILPVNKRLMAMDVHGPDVQCRAMLIRWGKLHNVRSGLGAGTVLLYGWASALAG